MNKITRVSEIRLRIFDSVGGAWIISAEFWLWYCNIPNSRPPCNHSICLTNVWCSPFWLWPDITTYLGNGQWVIYILSTNFIKGLHICACAITLCHFYDTVHRVLKARMLKWFAIPFSSGLHLIWTLHHDPSNLSGTTRHDSFFHWIRFAHWKKSNDKTKQHIKKQKHYFADKGLYSQSYGFSCSHVWIWELDNKKGFERKNWCLPTVVLEKTLESPLDSRKIKLVNPKGNQSWVFIGRTDTEANTLATWCKELTHWKRTWCWERLKAGEGDDRGWDGWVASWTQWTWV